MMLWQQVKTVVRMPASITPEEGLDLLARAFGIPKAVLWETLANQTIAVLITQSLELAFLAGLWAIMATKLIPAYLERWEKVRGSFDDIFLATLGMIMVIVPLSIITIITVGNFASAAGAYANPGFYAFEQLTRVIGQ